MLKFRNEKIPWTIFIFYPLSIQYLRVCFMQCNTSKYTCRCRCCSRYQLYNF